MASTYSTNLALELMANGDQSGTWGTTNNTNLGTLIEQAISGYVTQAITDGSGANTTITIPNGATGVARNMTIEMTGALTFATCSLIVPANKKLYFIYNNTTGGHPVTVKVSGQTGVAVPAGKKVILTSNGTDIVEAVNQVVGNFAVGGTTTLSGALIGAATQSVFNTVSTTVNAFGGASTALNIGNASGTNTVLGATTFSQAGVFSSTLGVTGVLTVAAGSVSAPSISSATGTADTGIYFPGTDILSVATAGTQRWQVTALGFTKASPDPAILFNATGAYHEMVTGEAGSDILRLRANHGSYTGTGIFLYIDRAASSAFNLMDLQAGAVSKFKVAGDGAVTIGGTLGVATTLSATYNAGDQIIASGWEAVQGGTTAAGSIRIGLFSTAYGRISYSTAGNTTLFIENSFDDASATIVLRTRTLGTPITGLQIAGTAVTIPGTLGVTGAMGMAGGDVPASTFAAAAADTKYIAWYDAGTSGGTSAYIRGTGGVLELSGSYINVVSQGLVVGSPTGSNKGAGTANFAADIYKNNTAYTNPDYVLEHWATGKIEKFADKEGASDYTGLESLQKVEEFARENLHLPRFGQNAGHGLFNGSDALLASVEEAYLHLFAHESRLAALEAKLA